MNIRQKLQSLGHVLPTPPKPVASYVPYVRSGSLVFVSGQLPMRDGKLMATGRVPSAQSVEQASAAAAQCAVNGLAVLDDALGGDWSRLVRVVRLAAFVASDDGFFDQPKVANGASDLLGAALGDRGVHARAAVGVNTLPLNATVEVELLAEITADSPRK